MKLLLKILGLSLMLYCVSGAEENEFFLARITYYTGPKTASGKKPVQGVTIAAEKKYKFGHRFYIPDLKEMSKDKDAMFIKMDVGPAVEKRTASKGRYPIIDVYVSNKKTINVFVNRYPKVVKVYLK